MKLKKAVDLCVKAGVVHLLDRVDSTGEVTQWLCDGVAAYPLYRVPYLDADTFCLTFDISEKKREKLAIKCGDMPLTLDLRDGAEGEVALEELPVTFLYGGNVLVPMTSRKHITFINGKYLRPLEDIEETLQMFERVSEDGSRYIVLKSGLLIAGIIFPVDLEKGNGDMLKHLGQVMSLVAGGNKEEEVLER